MNKISVILPDSKRYKWSYPSHFLNLFDWHGLSHKINDSQNAGDAKNDRPIYAINLNNQYRVEKNLSKSRHPNNHCVYDALCQKTYIETVEKNGVVLLDMSVEALLPRSKVMDGIMEGIRANSLNPANIAILNCNKKASSNCKAYWNKLGIKEQPSIVDFDTCFWLLSGFNRENPQNFSLLAERHESVQKSLSKKKRFKFVSFNGRIRPHRFYALLWLYSQGLFTNSAVSFLGYVGASKQQDLSAYLSFFQENHNNYPDIDNSLRFFNDFANSLPLTLDVSKESSLKGNAYKTVLPWMNQSPEYYDNSHFSVVIDTMFSEKDCLFLTPIAYKSFMNMSPFVYFGNCGALARMRELGFKTFAPYIDESYDNEVNNFSRMELALNQVKRIASMSDSELNDFTAQLWSVVSHNYWHIHRTVPANASKIFENQLISSLYR